MTELWGKIDNTNHSIVALEGLSPIQYRHLAEISPRSLSYEFAAL
jgi:hypothetical protein